MENKTPTYPMRLAEFITSHPDAILDAWDEFAKSNDPASLSMDGVALRDHAGQMLAAIARDLATVQTRAQGVAKSQARGPASDIDSAASTHGAARLIAGFTIDQLLAEYRALRSSVLRLWSELGCQGMATDIDDITRFNEAVDQALAESVTRYTTMISHAQHLFLAILGHDLRNPLNTTVVASSYLMRASNIDPAHAAMVARIHRSGVRMGRLVDDLIDYTRTHLGSALPMTMGKANMGMICRGTVEELRLANPERAIHFEPDADLDGVWDEGRLTQVFSNLLGNALQHGSASDPISMRVASGGSEIVVRIHNMGKAIDAGAVALIFDPLVRFSNPDSPPKVAEHSLGIGLYIARIIVEAHGGSIDVTSDAVRGTTFSVHLPRIPPLHTAARL
ncbi:MAG: HAMP domain-containing sensor histidine kinase [Pseudomonadota bacterium]